MTSRSSQWLGGAVTAVRTLTTIPMPGRDAAEMSRSLPWFPVVGLGVGAAAWAAAWAVGAAAAEPWPQAAALAALVASVALTGALHLDGVADLADGLFGTGDRRRALEIMKDSRVGAFGVIALAMVLLAKWVALTRLLEVGEGLWIIVAAAVSRAAMVELAASLPYARSEGGTGEAFVSGGRFWHRAVAWALAAVSAALLLQLWALVALGLTLAVTRGLAHWYRRRLGGVTGDLLGASCEAIDALVLLTGGLLAA